MAESIMSVKDAIQYARLANAQPPSEWCDSEEATIVLSKAYVKLLEDFEHAQHFMRTWLNLAEREWTEKKMIVDWPATIRRGLSEIERSVPSTSSEQS